MKRILLLAALMITLNSVSGQKSIDALFEKYSGKDGYTTVTINGDLLKLAASFDDDNDLKSLPEAITQIRILAQDDEEISADNFYDMVINDLDLTSYEEFMRVKEKDQDLRMLVRSEGNKFREFLLIAGGDDNAIIQIKGSMTYGEAKRLSENLKKNHGINITGDAR